MKYAIVFLLMGIIAQAQDEPGQWKYLGPGKTDAQVKGLFKSVWIDPLNPARMLAGSGSGGLFKTENANDQVPVWTNITDSYEGINFGVSGIVVIPNTNNKTIYIATGHNSGLPRGYGNGILKTANGGISWQQVGPKAPVPDLFMFEGIESNPQNPSEMLAYTPQELFLTTDGWKTFRKVKLPVDSTNKNISICDVDFAPYEPGKFYLCTRTYNFYAAKLFQYSSYGSDVKDITPPEVKAERIDVSTINSEKYKGKFYAALGTADIFVKFFDGKSYVSLNEMPVNQAAGGAYWHLELAVNQVDTNVIYLALTEVSRSGDGGKTFEKIATYNGENTHADVRAVAVGRSTPGGKRDVFVMANDGGLSLLDTTSIVKWKNLNGTGLDANQFWGIDAAQDDTLFVAGGTQDNGGFILKKDFVKNSMMGCGDGYMAVTLDNHSAIIECNRPTIIYHDVKTQQDVYLSLPDNVSALKRPIIQVDSFVYVACHDVWKINKYNLKKGETNFTTVTNFENLYHSNGATRNREIKAMAISNKGPALICYANPNWEEKENTGKIFYFPDFIRTPTQRTDITALLNHNTLEICRWYEINSVEMDLNDPLSFILSAKNPFDQTNSLLYKIKFVPDSNKCIFKKINANLPPPGINDIVTDKFSRLTYLATDNGVYYSDVSADSIEWAKLNSAQTKLPSVIVSDLSINYANNTIVAGTYGRGIWQTTLAKGRGTTVEVNKNSEFNEPFKVEGRVVIARKKILAINSKLIIIGGSVIELKPGSTLIIKNKSLVRNEKNKLIDLETVIHKGRRSKVIYR